MKAQGAELCIISDANTFYIDTILKAIITNPGHFDEQGRLHVSRFHGLNLEPHGCINPCQPNLCKGRELQKLVDAQSWDQIVYMGDSTNDFCPSTRLRAHDLVLARAELLLEKAIKAQPESVKANVTYWKSAQDVLHACNSIFNISSTKPNMSSTTTTSTLYSQLV
ncbi:putative phosphatase phospho1 [Mortierella alpina]|nr:putative phosphatase phospho1 [Mortierella alpina]